MFEGGNTGKKHKKHEIKDKNYTINKFNNMS